MSDAFTRYSLSAPVLIALAVLVLAVLIGFLALDQKNKRLAAISLIAALLCLLIGGAHAFPFGNYAWDHFIQGEVTGVSTVDGEAFTIQLSTADELLQVPWPAEVGEPLVLVCNIDWHRHDDDTFHCNHPQGWPRTGGDS